MRFSTHGECGVIEHANGLGPLFVKTSNQQRPSKDAMTISRSNSAREFRPDLDFISRRITGFTNVHGCQYSCHGSPDVLICQMPSGTDAATTSFSICYLGEREHVSHRPKPNVLLTAPFASVPSGVRCRSGLKAIGSSN